MSNQTSFANLLWKEVVDVFMAREKAGNPMNHDEKVDITRKFIGNFISGKYKAFGISSLKKEHCFIGETFWSAFLYEVKTDMFVQGIVGTFDVQAGREIYTNVIVDISGSKKSELTQRGRPANSSWMLVAAHACRIIHYHGYPERQIELVKLLEEALDKDGDQPIYSRESLVKLVAEIYKQQPK